MGEHVAECWPRELSGLEDKSDHIDRVAMGRCCVKADVPVQLVARVAGQLGSASPRRPDLGDLIPAVRRGARPDGCEVGKHCGWRCHRSSVRAI